MARTKGTTTFAADFEVEKRGPLDARGVVDTLADLILPATRQAHDGNEYTYVGMKTVVKDDTTEINGTYRLTAIDYTDPSNWVKEGGGESIGEARLDYGILFMSLGGLITQTTMQEGLNNGSTQYLFAGVRGGRYNNCFVDFVGYSGGHEVERFDGIQLSSENDMYTFMQANMANDGTNYDNIIKAYVYDIIDNEIPSINKVHGMNGFFSILVGSNNYKHGESHLPSNSKYGNYEARIEEAIQLMTPHTAYTYNAVDEPRRIFRRPGNHRSLYGMPNAGGMIDNNNTERYSINSSLNFVNNTGEYSVKHNDSYYCVLDLNTETHEFYAKHEMGDVIQYIGKDHYSVIACYQVKQGDRYSIYIKPVGVDTMYVDYFDNTKHSLEILHHARNQFTQLAKPSIKQQGIQANCSVINKEDRIYKGSGGTVEKGGLSKGGYREKPYTNFILRDITTNKISQKSKATVKWRSGRDKPLYATVNY